MRSVKALHDELDYWQMIGIADDIIHSAAMRPEYQHLVNEYGGIENTPENVRNKIKWILQDLNNELQLPWYQRPTFWALLRLSVKKFLVKVTSK